MEREISLTYKNDYLSYYEAQQKHAVIKGKLSKKRSLTVFFLSLLFVTIFEAISILIENDFKEEYSFYIIMFIIMVFTDFLIMLAMRAMNKSQIKNIAKMNFFHGFDTQSPKTAVFGENTMSITGGYSKVSVPYDEFDYVISDRMNFIFGFGGDMRVRNIPKTNQNPDDLFALDNLLREKLGDRFIYRMEELS